jgi:hypothetical protein
MLLVRDHQAQWLPVTAATAETVTAGPVTLPRDSLREFMLRDGGRLFLAQADLPALAEAERIRGLERSAVLRAVFGEGSGDRPATGSGLTWVQLLVGVFTLILVMSRHG